MLFTSEDDTNEFPDNVVQQQILIHNNNNNIVLILPVITMLPDYECHKALLNLLVFAPHPTHQKKMSVKL